MNISVEKLDALFREMGIYALFIASAYRSRYLYISDVMQKIDKHPVAMHETGGLWFAHTYV